MGAERSTFLTIDEVLQRASKHCRATASQLGAARARAVDERAALVLEALEHAESAVAAAFERYRERAPDAVLATYTQYLAEGLQAGPEVPEGPLDAEAARALSDDRDRELDRVIDGLAQKTDEPLLEEAATALRVLVQEERKRKTSIVQSAHEL